MRLRHEAQMLFVDAGGLDDLFQLYSVSASPDIDAPETDCVVVGTLVGASTN